MRSIVVVLTCMLLAGLASAVSDGSSPVNEQANECQENSEFRCCGDIQLVFRNPDLNPQGADRISAEGQLFAQFQAIGANADDIATFGFSFSAASAQAEESQVCNQQPWGPSGAYIINYRADQDPSDGYFINLQTTLVPDGDYMASVHAYDANNNEIARAWTLATVDNCAGGPGTRCDSDDYPTQEHVDQDNTMPWPIMLPGDGELDTSKNNAPGDATLTLEFAEPLSELRVFLNGKLLHDKVNGPMNMTEYDGRQWDDDLLPGYGPAGVGGIVAEECSQQPPQQCGFLGEAWYLAGTPITDDDIVRVEAIDMAGNLAKKELHIGSGVGGAVTDTLPNLAITVDTLEKQVAPGQEAIFRFELQNTGGTTAHPFPSAEVPAGWEWRFEPQHQPTPPGGTSVQELNARPPADAAPGIYQVNATITYPKGPDEESRTWQLTVLVGDAVPAEGGGGPAGTDDEDEGGEGEESPMPLVAALLAVLAAVRLRRRD